MARTKALVTTPQDYHEMRRPESEEVRSEASPKVSDEEFRAYWLNQGEGLHNALHRQLGADLLPFSMLDEFPEAAELRWLRESVGFDLERWAWFLRVAVADLRAIEEGVKRFAVEMLDRPEVTMRGVLGCYSVLAEACRRGISWYGR